MLDGLLLHPLKSLLTGLSVCLRAYASTEVVVNPSLRLEKARDFVTKGCALLEQDNFVEATPLLEAALDLHESVRDFRRILRNVTCAV